MVSKTPAFVVVSLVVVTVTGIAMHGAADPATLAMDGPETAAPGDTVTVSFTVTNTGGNESAYILNVSRPSDWAVIEQNNADGTWDGTSWLWQTIPPGEQVNPSLTLYIPGDASGTYTLSAHVKDADGIRDTSQRQLTVGSTTPTTTTQTTTTATTTHTTTATTTTTTETTTEQSGGGGGGGGGDVPPPSVQVTIEERTDTRFRARIVSARADSPGRVTLEDGITGGDVTVHRVQIVPASEDAESRFFIDVTASAAPPESVAAPDDTTLGYVQVTPTYISDTALAEVGLRIAVPTQVSQTPQNIQISHYRDGTWATHETRHIATRNEQYILAVATDSTGIFAVGVEPGTEATTTAGTNTTQTTGSPTTEAALAATTTAPSTEQATPPAAENGNGATDIPGFGTSTTLVAVLMLLTVLVRRQRP